MNLTSYVQDRQLTIALRGEIDHHAAREIMQALSAKIDLYLPLRCILDFRDVTFMDSSGIAVVIHTLRRMNTLQGRLLLQNIPPQPYKVLRAAGIEPGLRHVACSAASEQYPEYCLDAVRVGRRLFMDAPTAPRGDIREVSTWRSFVTMVHPRRAGEQIGYGGAVTLAHDALIATVGVGYGDGLNPALASAKAPVLIGRKRCTLLACCMDQCLIDVTGTDCRPGDEVVFFGYDRFGNCLPSWSELTVPDSAQHGAQTASPPPSAAPAERRPHTAPRRHRQ